MIIKVMLLSLGVFLFGISPLYSHNPPKIKVDGKEFVDFNKDGKLQPYEDYRLSEDKRMEDLVSRMTLEEKMGQMNQSTYFEFTPQLIKQLSEGDITSIIRMANPTGVGFSKPLDEMKLEEKREVLIQLAPMIYQNVIEKPINSGRMGSLINIVEPEVINKVQGNAINNSRLGIPMIIGRDVIHGFKTIFPIPLGQAASFDPQLVEASATVAATEAREKGVNWTFAPMLDISRDARWGRIAESFGEDTYLTGELGAAMVRGLQGKNLKGPHSVVACVKHFVGYGAAIGGRDYNSTTIPEHLMQNVYLPPFKKAIDAGAATLMPSFNDNDGIPASADSYLLRDVLRNDWKFDGFVVSDWNSILDMIAHGYAKDGKEAAMLSSNVGLDMDMASGLYVKYLGELVKEGKVKATVVDDAVRNILRIKFRMGLFENYFVKAPMKSTIYSNEHLQRARIAAHESAILLKNNNVLPLKESQKIAIIGPMADAPHDQLGTWVFDGDKKHTVTPLKALQTEYKQIKFVYEQALGYSRDKNTDKFEKAKQAALSADVAIIFVGEESILSGEAHSLSNINLIGVQSDLIKAVKSTGKPVVVVIMAGRPLTIERDLQYTDAMLYNFHPGTMGGLAIMDLLFGKVNPSGKLPVTFVREVGQIPMYYNYNNTGRPSVGKVMTLDEISGEAGQTSLGNTSFYLDSGKEPLFPFGYGLSYSKFEYSNLRLSSNKMTMNGSLTAKVTIKNNSPVNGTEVVQLYIQDIVASVVRPVKELKGFKRVFLNAGESKEVEFTISSKDLAFYGKEKTFKAETGDFNIWIGTSSASGLKDTFVLE